MGRNERRQAATVSEDVAALAREWGMQIPVDRGDEDVSFEVAEANWQSLLFFLACDTQWRVVLGMAGLLWIGLDYTACDVVARRMQVSDDDLADLWADLKVMEGAALPELNDRD